MSGRDALLTDWRARALSLEENVKKVVIGQDGVIRRLNTAVFARGHVMLEGDVGVGKTTLLRALARGIGGAFERVEGTVDLMPNDLVYYTYIGEDGKPRVDPGPLLKHGEALSIFFFNEINRARPQVHSLMLRAMAERSATAFNREYRFPHMLVFADRNRVEKDETFEISSAARDRFMMEVLIETPADHDIQRSLMFDTGFHDVDQLLERIPPGSLAHTELNQVSQLIQDEIQASPTLERYALELWRATRDPQEFGITISGINTAQLIQAGASPRGMAMLLRAARIRAWLANRPYLLPDDIREVFFDVVGHRIFFTPLYEMRRSEIARMLLQGILNKVATP